MRPSLSLADRLETLLGRLAAELPEAVAAATRATPGVPRPVTVLVPSPTLADVLRGALARRLGVTLGVEFLSPAAWLRGADGPGGEEFARAAAAWAPDQLRWRLLPHLAARASHLGFAPEAPTRPRDLLAAAELLARQFDRYTRARPAWIAAWAGGRTAPAFTAEPRDPAAQAAEAWQRDLWADVARDLPDLPPPPCLLDRIGARGTAVFHVALGGLDPLLLDVLTALAGAGTPVRCHVLLPSLGYLGDTRRRDAWISLLAGAEGAEDASGGHPLLATLGRQATGTFLQLGRISEDYAEWEAPEKPAPAAGSLLQLLQADIRAQRPPEPTGRRPFDPTRDASLRVHCCHGPRRELEVLRDELLRAFRDLPGLQPADIVVATTDLDAYAPLAEGVLGSGPAGRLPFRLAVVPAREANPVAHALLALLRLALGRRTASEVLDLLHLPALQAHLTLDEEARGRLADGVRGSGLTHGSTGGPDDAGSWPWAVDRIAAGCWFGTEPAARDPEGRLVLPLADDLGGAEADRRRFAAWLTTLSEHLRRWNDPAPARDWAERLDTALTALLACADLDDATAAARRLLGHLRAVPTETPLDAGAVLDWLDAELENATSARSSFGGEILIGRPEQVHGLPCRVLAILGLEDGSFPRAERRPAWDLLALRPERWDPDRRSDDRQWFLDSLLAPADRLILTAANRSRHSPHDGPLSACVADLLRVADTTVPPPADAPDRRVAEHLVVAHPLHPFAASYFLPESALPPTFDPVAAAIAADLAAPPPAAVPFFGEELLPATPAPAALTLEELARFWLDPARGTLRALEIATQDAAEDDTALDDPPLDLRAWERFHVREAALDPETTGAGDDLAQARLHVRRLLPPGHLGRLAWAAEVETTRPLAEAVARSRALVRPAEHAVRIGGTELTGRLPLGAEAGADPWALVARPVKFASNPGRQLEAWILAAFAAAALGRPVGARVHGLDHPQGIALAPISPPEAQGILATLLEGYRHGQAAPLAFAPRTSDRVRWALGKSKPPLASAAEVWTVEAFEDGPEGEGLAPAAQTVWRDLDPFAPPHAAAWVRWAERVSQPVAAWWDTGATLPR